LMYGEGISAEGDVLDLGVKHDLIDKSGAWYSINGERMGQGRDQAKQFLKEHPEMMKDLRAKVLHANNIGPKSSQESKPATAQLAAKAEEAEDQDSSSKKASPAKKARKH
jgi:recombination protein RecA